MKLIQLTQGQVAIIDDEDYERVSKRNWYAKMNNVKCKTVFYAATNITTNKKRTTVRMHQFILGKPPIGKEIDHKNGNTLDNRKENLRFCTRSQNRFNGIGSKPSPMGIYKGVDYIRSSKRFRARININGRKTHLACFATAKEAALCYNDKAKELYGEYALLNVII